MSASKVLTFAFGKTGYRGVHWDTSKLCYCAEIGNRDRGTRKRLGKFATAKAAAEAYDMAAVEMYGQEAVLNFPLGAHRTVVDCSADPPRACASGHAMTEANLYLDPAGRRQCRECNRSAANRYYQRKKARDNAG